MDESVKRRERLKAMREEASTATVETTSMSPPHSLSNPFLQTSAANFTVQQDSAPRFDFYTDPMAAYSGNRTSNAAGYQRPGASHMAPIPLYPPPSGMANPETTQFHSNYLPPPSNQGIESHRGRSGQGRGHWFDRGPSPCPNPGRGTDQWLGNNIGRGRGRVQVSRDHVTAQDRPDRFYHKSMVEDPWKFQEPVLWSREDDRSSWLPKSLAIGTKKARVSESPSQLNSQFNLAEYLSASFNEALEEEVDR